MKTEICTQHKPHIYQQNVPDSQIYRRDTNHDDDESAFTASQLQGYTTSCHKPHLGAYATVAARHSTGSPYPSQYLVTSLSASVTPTVSNGSRGTRAPRASLAQYVNTSAPAHPTPGEVRLTRGRLAWAGGGGLWWLHGPQRHGDTHEVSLRCTCPRRSCLNTGEEG